MQFTREATGGILSSVPQERLRNVYVPRVDATSQSALTTQVAEAHRLYRESQAGLLSAKRLVDQVIDAAAPR